MANSRVLEWIAHASDELNQSRGTFVSAHADEISGVDVMSRVAVLDLFSLVARNRPSASHARLALPYGYSSDADTNLPDLAMPARDTSDEPPSIYLFADGFFSFPSDREEYRCPYPRTPWGDSYSSEYVCSRSMRDRALSWEFSRTVWVRHAGSGE